VLALQQWEGNSSSVMINKRLHQFESAVRAIPRSKLPIDHHFYSFQQELGQLMNFTVYASLAVGQEDYSHAVRLMQAAVSLQDSFSYMEPENFYFPIRHCLGAAKILMLTHRAGNNVELLVDDERSDIIEGIYLDDLRVHPHNYWALRGLQALHGLSDPFSAEEGRDSYDAKIYSSSSCCELGLC
jgi:hypothetical protein